MASRVVLRAFSSPTAAHVRRSLPRSNLHPASVRFCVSSLLLDSSMSGWRYSATSSERRSISRGFGKVFASERGYRKVRRRPVQRKDKELELSVNICMEEQLPDDSEIQDIAEMLRLNVPMAMKLAFDGLKDLEYKTRDPAVDDVGCFETVELSVLLCNDEFIRNLNKEWRDEDHATDVLSMSQHIPELKLPTLMLGDIVISVETAARQAEERGHTLLDEIRILTVHGLLHLLGFDHEISDEAETEMEKAEELLLKCLGWKGKGLIQSANDGENNGIPHSDDPDDRKKEGSLRFYKPKFSYIFCDMDGTLLNSQSQISSITAKALREALSRGVKVVIATGKSRPAVVSVLKMVDLVGKDGIMSEFSPGVFVQGLLVYGRQGREIFRRNLDPGICREDYACLKHDIDGWFSLKISFRVIGFLNCQSTRQQDLQGSPLFNSTLFVHCPVRITRNEGHKCLFKLLFSSLYRETTNALLSVLQAFLYSLEHKIPLIAFSEDCCLTLFDHPLVDSLHTKYHEPKAEIMPSVEHLVTGGDIQKLIFLDTAEGVATKLRPYWSEATGDRATVVQAVPDILEIVPSGTSKGSGVRMLLDHLGVPANEIMAIGDGENDVEMLELASLGIALSNGSDEAKAVANVIGASNNEDGVADAIYRYAF